MKKELDIIWNLSLVCPWDCEFCCTDAVHVSKARGNIIVRENSLSRERLVNDADLKCWPNFLGENNILPNYLDKALRNRQENGFELSLDEKLTVLSNLDVAEASIDFAGGDPLACAENIIVVVEAAKKFGKEQVSVTSTGHSISRYPLTLLSENIGVFEFSYDEPRACEPVNRPRGYNYSNLKAAAKLSNMGVYTKCQIPLHDGNVDKARIKKIVVDLAESGVNEVLLMRTFPVGRGLEYIRAKKMLSKETLLQQIQAFCEYSEQISGPKIRLQCALKHMSESLSQNNPCDLLQSSYGINYEGRLLLSAWATNERGGPLSDEFVLGSLVSEAYSDIARSDKHVRLKGRLNENFGHCKIFAYIYSDQRGEDALFSSSDPLYLSG